MTDGQAVRLTPAQRRVLTHFEDGKWRDVESVKDAEGARSRAGITTALRALTGCGLLECEIPNGAHAYFGNHRYRLADHVSETEGIQRVSDALRELDLPEYRLTSEVRSFTGITRTVTVITVHGWPPDPRITQLHARTRGCVIATTTAEQPQPTERTG